MESEIPAECWTALYLGLGNAKSQGEELKERFQPLSVLKPTINRVVNFGYWHTNDGIDRNEPYALAWTLDAPEVVVVDKDEKSIRAGQENLVGLRKRVPSCFVSCSIQFILGDMTKPIPELRRNYFDLSFCERVLLQICDEHGQEGLAKAITQMAQIVKPGGCIIACERPSEYLPENTEHFFEEAGLTPNKDIGRRDVFKDAFIYNKLL